MSNLSDFIDIKKPLGKQKIPGNKIEDFYKFLDSGLENTDDPEYAHRLGEKDLSDDFINMVLEDDKNTNERRTIKKRF